MKFYKRDPDAAIAGMNQLTFEQRGAYNSLLDLLYSRDGEVPDDDVLVARMMAVHWRQWKRLKGELILAGKVWSEGGKLCARRVQECLREAAEVSQTQRRHAAERWVKSKNANENNDRLMPPGNASIAIATPIIKANALMADAPEPEKEVAPVVALGKRITDLMGVSDDPRWLGNWSLVQAWLNEGFTAEGDIIPVVTRIIAGRRSNNRAMPKSLAYFTQAIRDHYRTRTGGIPSSVKNGEFVEVVRGSPEFTAWIEDQRSKGKKIEWLKSQKAITIPSQFINGASRKTSQNG